MTRNLFAIALFPMMLLVTPTAPAAAAEPVEEKGKVALSEIAAAWNRREQRIRTGEFEWDELRVMSRSPTDLKRDPFSPAARTATDQQTYRHQYQRKLLFKDDKLRFFNNESVWFLEQGAYLPYESVQVFDGRVYKTLEERSVPKRFRYQGSVLPGTAEMIHDLIGLKPLFLHFRPSRYDERFLSRFTVAGHDGVIDDKRCVILQRVKDPAGPVLESLWLDPNHEFCMRRLLSEVGHVVTTRFDVFYDLDATHGPIPTGWKLVERFSNGEFDRSIEATVTTGKVNHQIADDRFTLEFPVKTLVYDAGSSSGAVSYIVRPDGQKRVVLPEERRRAKTADELIRTETGRAGIEQPERSGWLQVLLPAAVITVALVVALGIYRLRRA